ncbi:DUF4328 domain-containing protein [Akkermansiaceae bacterium]|nr:DUF4328 domain-containing protein [Akkermansiaceae bacterium]
MSDEINPYAAPSSKLEAAPPEPNHSGAGKSPYGPYRNNKGLAITITLFMITFILCRIAEGFIAFEALAIVQHREGFFGISDIEELAAYERKLILFSLPIGILIMIFWCVWTNRSCKNAWLFRVLTGRYLRPGSGESYTPGWAVGWYFVPFAMLWKPFQAIAFIRDSIQSSRGKSMGPLLGL